MLVQPRDAMRQYAEEATPRGRKSSCGLDRLVSAVRRLIGSISLRMDDVTVGWERVVERDANGEAGAHVVLSPLPSDRIRKVAIPGCRSVG